jgi:hypothetical protein
MATNGWMDIKPASPRVVQYCTSAAHQQYMQLASLLKPPGNFSIFLFKVSRQQQNNSLDDTFDTDKWTN